MGGKTNLTQDYGETESMLAPYKCACTVATMRQWSQNGDRSNRSFYFSFDSRETSERGQAMRRDAAL